MVFILFAPGGNVHARATDLCEPNRQVYRKLKVGFIPVPVATK